MIFLGAWFVTLAALLATVSDFAHRRLAMGGAVVAGIVMLHELVFDVVAQKIAGNLAMPVGWAWTACFIAMLLAMWHRRRRLIAATTITFILFTLAGNSWVGAVLMRDLQEELPVTDWRNEPEFDAVLVLGGGTTAGQFDNMPQLSSSGDRVMLGARIWHAKKTRWLVSSGRELPGLGARSLAEDTRRIWGDIGIPAEVIVELAEPHNTKGELEAFATLVKARGWKRLGVVSSAYHLPRALSHAKRLNLTLIPLPAQWVLPPRFSPLDLVVRRSGFWMVQTALWEHVGRAVGR